MILTDDPSAQTNLHEPLEEIAAGEELEVKVVAPLRPQSTLDLVTVGTPHFGAYRLTVTDGRFRACISAPKPNPRRTDA